MSEQKFIIERNVPIPDIGHLRGRKPKYPWREMKKGDSFYVTGDEHAKMSAKNAASQYAKVHGKKFIARTDADGVRIWRIE